MSEELKPTGSIGDYAKFHQLLNAAYEACGALNQATGKEAFPASDGLTEAQNSLIEYIDDWAVRRASRPEAESEMPADEQVARDAFDLAWRQALSDAAFYVAGHCANGEHHAEHVLELQPPVLRLKGQVAGNAARDDARDAPSINTPVFSRMLVAMRRAALGHDYVVARDALVTHIDAAIKASKQPEPTHDR